MPFDIRTQQPFVAADRNNWYGVLARDFMTTRVDTGTVRLGWDIAKNVKLSSIGRYSWNLNSYIASAPESPLITDPNPANWTVAANPKSRNARSTFYGNQTQVRFDFDTGGLAHKLVVGGEISREKVENKPWSSAQSETVGAPIVPAVAIRVNLFDPSPNTPWVSATGAPLVRALSGARTTVTIDSKALFALDTIDITPKLQVSAGIRYDNFDEQVNSLAAPSTAVPTPLPVILDRKDNFVNWNAGVVYKPIPAVSIYFSAATSANPSGEQTDGAAASYGGLTAQNVNLGPEKNQAYEVGVKWQPGGHLMLTAALFRTTKNNARVTPVGGGNATPLELTGKQRAQGLELSASGNITKAWSVFGGFVLLDTEVLDTPNPANIGARFPNQPKTSASLLSTYKVTQSLSLGGQVSYYSKRYGGNNLSNSAGTVVGGVVTAQPTLPAYWRFDANARIKLNDMLEFQINGLNLTDKRYFEALYQSATPFSYQAPGRSVLGTFRVIF
jgi:catecholate siderophore receptor